MQLWRPPHKNGFADLLLVMMDGQLLVTACTDERLSILRPRLSVALLPMQLASFWHQARKADDGRVAVAPLAVTLDGGYAKLLASNDRCGRHGRSMATGSHQATMQEGLTLLLRIPAQLSREETGCSEAPGAALLRGDAASDACTGLSLAEALDVTRISAATSALASAKCIGTEARFDRRHSGGRVGECRSKVCVYCRV